ncbi:hypothetical protein PISMIDRAFT_101693 [Pisolithus microcarpus 441]|uniref:Uncharacterized protein n=1 Tax=Pisolithus microcarpus 441 TaxID=765257 RepID=A0A0C9ZA46_9AGAM|nr:hypothetical protein PISMIDRAFT_101693 [Pisolithus microcarpus 441]
MVVSNPFSLLTCKCLRSSLAKRDTINDIITKEYKSLIQDIPKDDTAARREKLKHVYEWSENSSTVPTSKSVKSITARVQNAKMQFSGLAKAWSNLEEIEIAGVVMYVGQDPAGCQTSGIFGGSDMYKKLKGDPLRKLVVPSLCQKLGAMYDGPSDDDEEQDSLDGVPEIEIRPWNQDVIKMSESPNLKGEIPLIKAADGVVLCKVSDDLSWQKKTHEGEDTRHEGRVDPLQQHQLPFPSCK